MTEELLQLARIQIGNMDKTFSLCANMFAFDIDGNGVVTTEEIDRTAETVVMAIKSPPGPKDRCILPTLEYHHSRQLAVFGVGRGELGPDGLPEVELFAPSSASPGPMLVFSQEPTVWRYNGDPEKVVILIVAGESLDVVGLPPEKVVYVPRSNCTTFSLTERLTAEQFILEGQIANAAGWHTLVIARMVESAARMPPRR